MQVFSPHQLSFSHQLINYLALSHRNTLFLKKYLFIYLWRLSKSCRILVLGSGLEFKVPAVEVQSLNRWTAREVPRFHSSPSAETL